MAGGRSNVFVVGLGLIGGSVALGLKRAGWPGLLLGYDSDPETVEFALKAGAIDRTVDLAEGCRAADLIYLAVPVVTVPEVLKEMAGPLAERVARADRGPAAVQDGMSGAGADLPVVTDCGSVKVWVCEAARRTLPESIRFVGGHPMAGSERIGFGAAGATLLAGCTYVLTTDNRDDADEGRQAVPQAVLDLVAALGARPLITDAAAHDRAVALISHLPLAVAATLSQSALSSAGPDGPALQLGRSDEPDLAWKLAAGGFRDTTRVASGSPEMAAGICLANRDSVLEALRAFRRHLDDLERSISESRPADTLNYFTEAKLRRDTWVAGAVSHPEGGRA